MYQNENRIASFHNSSKRFRFVVVIVVVVIVVVSGFFCQGSSGAVVALK